MRTMLRVGLCGFGYGHQRDYGEAILRQSGVRGIGVCPAPGDSSMDIQTARAAAQRLNVPFFDKLEALIAATEPDLMSLAVRPLENPAAVEYCAERKIGVLCEKPLAIDEEGMERIRRAIADSGSYFCMALAAAKFARPIELLREQVQRGAIGHPRVAYYQYLQPKGPMFTKAPGTVGATGELENFAPYALVFLHEIFQAAPCEVYCQRGARFYPWYDGMDIDDLAVIHLQYPGNGIATVVVGRTTTQSLPATDLRIEVIGDAGVVHADHGLANRIVGYHPITGSDEDWDRGGLTWHRIDMPDIDRFAGKVVESVRKGLPAPISLEEAISAQRVIATCLQQPRVKEQLPV